ncbi:hypothetical protein BFINE_48730 [Bacteroides finegoldii DSM 17565]|nr:hypothetical protein BFINE_48730 [Bacteroides finegoldii DSM 17565]
MLAAAREKRQQGNSEKNDAKPTNPLGQTSPKEQSVREGFDMIQYRGPVVVNPDMVSKKASATEVICPLNRKGSMPSAENSIHERLTMQ